MPYSVRRKGSKFVVVNTDTGKVKGTHESAAKARRQINLLRGIEHGWKPTGKKPKK